MLCVSPSPADFPPPGVSCLYLFQMREDVVKIGLSSNLSGRWVKHRKPVCLAFCSPIFDPRKVEEFLIGEFSAAFPRFTGREWFRASPREARQLFLRLFQYAGRIPGVLCDKGRNEGKGSE